MFQKELSQRTMESAYRDRWSVELCGIGDAYI